MTSAFLPILAAAAFTSPLVAQLPGSMGEVTNPANNHVYHILEESTWTDAQAAAVLMGGHLVTIDDVAEDTWVFDTFGNWANQPRDMWIGFNDINAEGSFEWASGDPITYTNWAPGQPDNYLGNNAVDGEDHVHMYGFGSIYGPGEWNDMHDAAPGTAGWTFGLYGIVELEGPAYSISNLVGGSTATLSIANASPFGGVLIGFSFTGAGPTTTPFGVVDMSPPIKTGPFLTADIDGVASIGLFVPAHLAGRVVYTQAVDLNSGMLTNSLAEVIQ